uniref:Uncharacterized protein n=1 Tax=Lotus japonicus TaxID=34305 RepID=I3SVX5_LOTJA|nr:unknown [Lotus japonicus]
MKKRNTPNVHHHVAAPSPIQNKSRPSAISSQGTNEKTKRRIERWMLSARDKTKREEYMSLYYRSLKTLFRTNKSIYISYHRITWVIYTLQNFFSSCIILRRHHPSSSIK